MSRENWKCVAKNFEKLFLFTQKNTSFRFLNNDLWWLEVTFLNDLFEKLNALNLSLQGANENIITITGKLKAFDEKLTFWIKLAIKKNLEFLPAVKFMSK